jgi:hypothetical protein
MKIIIVSSRQNLVDIHCCFSKVDQVTKYKKSKVPKNFNELE